MSQFLTFENVLLVLGGATALAIWAYRTWSKQTAETKLARILLIQNFCQSAYLAVHALAPTTQTSVDDKVAEALKRVAEALAAQTGQPLTADESGLAKLQLQATAGKVALGAAAVAAPPK